MEKIYKKGDLFSHPYPMLLRAEWELQKEKDPATKVEIEKELMESYAQEISEEENNQFHNDWLSEEENRNTKKSKSHFFKSPSFAPLDGESEAEYAEDFDVLLENIA